MECRIYCKWCLVLLALVACFGTLAFSGTIVVLFICSPTFLWVVLTFEVPPLPAPGVVFNSLPYYDVVALYPTPHRYSDLYGIPCTVYWTHSYQLGCSVVDVQMALHIHQGINPGVAIRKSAKHPDHRSPCSSDPYRTKQTSLGNHDSYATAGYLHRSRYALYVMHYTPRVMTG